MQFRFKLTLLIVFPILLMAILWFFVPLSNNQTVTIVLKETGFEPQNATIQKGDTIVFKTERGQEFWPASDLHPTHGVYPEFDPQEPVAADKSWEFRFNKIGIWKYHDHLDPFFRGTITVE